MKILKIAALLVCITCMGLGMASFKGTSKHATTEQTVAPPSGTDVSFKSVTCVGDSVATCNARYTEFQNWQINAGDTFRLALSQLKNGGTYRILVKKTVSGAILVRTYQHTLIGGGTSVALTGSTNSYHWLNVTNNGTVNIIQKE